ncbi:MAG TPA: glycosyltransferase [Methylomirabilota bacterium]|nr:glycosyltransferase [Methylomirabilota bacterium]
MNILMLGRWLPPPRRPVRGLREYQFARHLVRQHRLTLAFVADNPDAAGAISALRSEFGDLEFSSVPRGWKSLSSAVRLATGESCTLSYFRSEALRTRLAERMRRTRYDIVLVLSSTMIQYALDTDPTIPVVVDFAGVGSEWWLQQAARGTFPGTRFFRTEAARLRAAETAAARRAARCIAERAEAARIVESFGATGPITVIENGVDVEMFGYGPRQGTTPTVLLSMSGANEADLRDTGEFWRKVVPAVRAHVPSVRFVTVCREPLPSGRLNPGSAGVEVAGPGYDMRPLLHSRTVAAAPWRAESDLVPGVLEPMAAGVPVVVTSQVRSRLGGTEDPAVCIADDPAQFASELVRLLERDADRKRAGQEARRFIEANYSWEVHAAHLGEVLSEVANRATKKPVAVASAPKRIAAALGG